MENAGISDGEENSEDDETKPEGIAKGKRRIQLFLARLRTVAIKSTVTVMIWAMKPPHNERLLRKEEKPKLFVVRS